MIFAAKVYSNSRLHSGFLCALLKKDEEDFKRIGCMSLSILLKAHRKQLYEPLEPFLVCVPKVRIGQKQYAPKGKKRRIDCDGSLFM